MDGQLWKKTEELFIQCADMGLEDARAFLDRECSDPAIREAVEKLLLGDARDDDVGTAVGRAARSLAESRKHSWVGTRVGAYTVTSRIAEGGMGVIYKATRSDQHFEQHVAIKLLTGTVATRELRARFLAERQILANLNHVNIAKLLDGGETDSGVPFLVMEYIDGLPVDEYCAVNRLTIDERISLFLQICSAVQYAHGNLIVHRDIKPSNILVAADGVPKLLDFGIAKILDGPDGPAGTALTVDGSRLLTPRHASPEQILGKQITTASDVYSLGILLYELLCGRFPYNLETTTRASEVENTIVYTDPLAPSVRVQANAAIDAVCRERRTAGAKLRQKLRGDLDTIVLTALRKEPGLRYGSVKEFADDLRRAAEHRPIMARPPTLSYLLSRYWQRHRSTAVGIIAIVLVTIAGVTVSTVGFFQARTAERIAVAESRKAATTSEFLVGLFRASDPEETAGEELSVSEVLRLGVERIETGMEDAPLVKSNILETLSSVYKGRSDYAESARLMQHALRLHEAHAPDDPVGRARLNNDLGDLYRLLERFDEATRHLELAYAIDLATGNNKGDAHADVTNNLALVYGVNGRADEVAGMLLEVLRLRQNLYTSPHPLIALSLHNLAWHFNLAGNPEEAERYGLQALEMRTGIFGDVHPRVASTLGELGDIYFDQAKWAKAEAAATRALSIAEQVYEPGHRTIAYQMSFLARARHVRGDLQGASALFVKLIADSKQTLGPEHPTVAIRLTAYARCLLDLGNYRQAETVLREALAILEVHADGPPGRIEQAEILLAQTLLSTSRLDKVSELLDPGHAVGELPERLLLRARLALAQGDAAQAEQLTTVQLQELHNTVGHHLPLLPEILQVQGRSLIATGRAAEAVDVLQRALTIYADWWNEDYWRADLVRVDLGVALMRNGKPAEGRSLLARSAAGLGQKLGVNHPDTRRAVLLLEDFSVQK